jgi:hypothetical protein
MKSGFLIRGQVPSLKGKALRKSPDASRGYPSFGKNLSLFQVKYKKEKGIFAIHVVSKSGNHLFSKIPFSLNS